MIEDYSERSLQIYNETKNKDVMRPYSSQDEGNYIDYNKNQKKTQPSTNFSSKRMIH